MSFEVNANRDGLDALIAQVEKAQRKALREMGRVVLKKAKEYAPEDTGALMESGRVELRGKDSVAIVFGGGPKTVRYALSVHEGPVRVRSGRKAFLRDAIMDTKPILEALRKAYVDTLKG